MVAAGDVARVEWGDEVGQTADQVAAAISEPADERNARGEVKAWLQEMLCAGPVKSGLIMKGTSEQGFAMRTVMRAKKDLDIASYPHDGKSYWHLPGTDLGVLKVKGFAA